MKIVCHLVYTLLQHLISGFSVLTRVDPLLLEAEVGNLKEAISILQSRQELFYRTQRDIQHVQQRILKRLDTIETVLKRRHGFSHQSREPPQTYTHSSDSDTQQYHNSSDPHLGQASHPAYTEPCSFDRYPNTQPSTYDPPDAILHNQSSGSTGHTTELFTSLSREPEQHAQVAHGPEPFPVKFVGHSLPSMEIEREKLQDPSAVLAKYPKLRCESRIATLAVKLAKDAYFGVKVLSKCTVMGERELPGLPRAELSELKKLLFLQFPNFWHSKQQFEPIWKLCIDAVGQLCKRERSKSI